MITGDFIIIAQNTANDDKNRLSIHGIFDQLHSKGVPVGLTNATIICKIRSRSVPIVNKPLKIKITFSIDGNELNKIEQEQVMTIEKNKAWCPIFNIDVLPFKEFGTYDVDLYVNNKKIASTQFDVKDEAELKEK